MRTQTRALHASSAAQAKVVVALYPDPVTGYPPKYARDDIPEIKGYNDGQTAPTPQGIDFTPGELLGCVSGELGLRKYLESNGHTLVVTSDKYVLLWFLGYTQPCIICSHTRCCYSRDGDGCELEKELVDADIVISQPFYPAYITRKRMEMAPKLKMAITAGIGSDHVDLQAAIDHKVP